MGERSRSQPDGPGEANGCAVDPKTGNLAVANASSVGGSRLLWRRCDLPQWRRNAINLFDSAISSSDYCAYDSGGNLYVSAHDGPTDIIGELPSGSGSFSNITLTEDIGPVSMQWVGSSLVVSSFATFRASSAPSRSMD